MEKYNEIFRLKEMLYKANIPFEWREIEGDGYQIGYPVLPPKQKCVCDAIQRRCSYGAEEDKLEIMGLLTKEEAEEDSIAGYLTAEDVFERMRTHYEHRNENN